MSARDLKWAQLKVGITVAVSALLLVLVIFAVSGQYGWFTHRIHLTTFVNDAGGMRPGAEVNLNGVVIGNVTDVQLAAQPPDPQNPVKVVMQVTPDPRWLRADSMVELGTNGPLGETLVNIAAGSPSAPPAADGTILPAQPSTGINELLVSTHSVVENANLMVQRVGDILNQIQNGNGSISKLINSSELYNKFVAVAANLQDITDQLKAGRGTLGKLYASDDTYTKLNATLDNLNELMDAVQHGPGTAAKLLNDPELYNRVDALIASLQKTVDALNGGQGAIGSLLKSDSATSQNLEKTIASLQAMTESLQKGNGTAGKLLQDPTLYNNLNTLSVNGSALLEAIRANPKKYLTIYLKIF